DDFALGVHELQLLQHLHSGHTRHHHIQNHDVELTQAGQLQRLLAVGRFLNLISTAHKATSDRLAKVSVVVYQQQVNLLGVEGHGLAPDSLKVSGVTVRLAAKSKRYTMCCHGLAESASARRNAAFCILRATSPRCAEVCSWLSFVCELAQ